VCSVTKPTPKPHHPVVFFIPLIHRTSCVSTTLTTGLSFSSRFVAGPKIPSPPKCCAADNPLRPSGCVKKGSVFRNILVISVAQTVGRFRAEQSPSWARISFLLTTDVAPGPGAVNGAARVGFGKRAIRTVTGVVVVPAFAWFVLQAAVFELAAKK